MTGLCASNHLCFAFTLRNWWMTTSKRAHAHTHTQWPEAYPFNHYVNFKECFRDKSAISLLAHAGRSEEGRENVRRKTYGHLREQRGMTDRGREGGDGALWSPLVTALQERESKARTALLNELMTRTFDVHYNKKKKRKEKEQHPHSFLTHIFCSWKSEPFSWSPTEWENKWAMIKIWRVVQSWLSFQLNDTNHFTFYTPPILQQLLLQVD